MEVLLVAKISGKRIASFSLSLVVERSSAIVNRLSTSAVIHAASCTAIVPLYSAIHLTTTEIYTIGIAWQRRAYFWYVEIRWRC